MWDGGLVMNVRKQQTMVDDDLHGSGAHLEGSPKNFVPLRPSVWLTQRAYLTSKQIFRKKEGKI